MMTDNKIILNKNVEIEIGWYEVYDCAKKLLEVTDKKLDTKAQS